MIGEAKNAATMPVPAPSARKLAGIGLILLLIVRRKPGAAGRAMAYSRSGSILSVYGNSLDYPIETIGEMDRDGIVPRPLNGQIEPTVLVDYISIA